MPLAWSNRVTTAIGYRDEFLNTFTTASRAVILRLTRMRDEIDTMGVRVSGLSRHKGRKVNGAAAAAAAEAGRAAGMRAAAPEAPRIKKKVGRPLKFRCSPEEAA